jgi:hypothetical protein
MLKSALISVAVLSSVPAFATSRAVCLIKIGRASSNYTLVQDRFNVGEVTRTDVKQSQLELLNTQLGCNQILIDDYCNVAVEAAATMVQGITEEARQGQRTAKEVDDAQAMQDDVTDRCQ